jgi:hypothetical protein
MKSDKDDLYIKIVELNKIYDFAVDKFFLKKIFKLPKVIFKFSNFEIQDLEFPNDFGR